MKVTGSMIELMDMESILIQMEHAMRVNGIEICSMEKEKKIGLMALSLKVNIEKARRTE